MKVVLVGEGMLELSSDGASWHLGHGGDTLNIAIHLARTGMATSFLSALGSDPFSQKLRSDWALEGVDTSLILTHPSRAPGMYAITTDPRGERSFTYWRNDSAVRDMLGCPGAESAFTVAESADLLGFSLITLAVLSSAARERLLHAATQVRRHGGRVMFDGNYRPRLWSSVAEAQRMRDAAIACADIGLPTLDDEALLSGATDAESVAHHWMELGCRETVVKLGAHGCRLPDGTTIAPPKVLEPVDTSGAGDAFDAGYLNARLRGSSIAEAAMAGHRLAGWCVMRRGAIPARD
jgi:2-dehydro-3-deoxygluconokinase